MPDFCTVINLFVKAKNFCSATEEMLSWIQSFAKTLRFEKGQDGRTTFLPLVPNAFLYNFEFSHFRI